MKVSKIQNSGEGLRSEETQSEVQKEKNKNNSFVSQTPPGPEDKCQIPPKIFCLNRLSSKFSYIEIVFVLMIQLTG